MIPQAIEPRREFPRVSMGQGESADSEKRASLMLGVISGNERPDMTEFVEVRKA
jgi:hypothetical protein